MAAWLCGSVTRLDLMSATLRFVQLPPAGVACRRPAAGGRAAAVATDGVVNRGCLPVIRDCRWQSRAAREATGAAFGCDGLCVAWSSVTRPEVRARGAHSDLGTAALTRALSKPSLTRALFCSAPPALQVSAFCPTHCLGRPGSGSCPSVSRCRSIGRTRWAVRVCHNGAVGISRDHRATLLLSRL